MLFLAAVAEHASSITDRTVITVGAVVTLVSLASALVNIWDKVREKPAPNEKFATKAELIAVDSRLSQGIANAEQDCEKDVTAARADVSSRFAGLEAQLNAVKTDLTNLGRGVARIEGILATQPTSTKKPH